MQNSLRESHFTKDELARELGRSTRTLDRWHTERIGPPRAKIGALILYPKARVFDWLERQAEAER